MMQDGMMGGGMMSNGSAPPQTRTSPQQKDSSAPEQAFAETCSQCHALPSPAQHSAAEWPSVVQRMEHYMQSSGLTPPDQRTTGEIIDYLQTHAADH